jgi:hypothetical protein
MHEQPGDFFNPIHCNPFSLFDGEGVVVILTRGIAIESIHFVVLSFFDGVGVERSAVLLHFILAS